MTTETLPGTANSGGLSSPLKTILIAGFLVGVLDATAAMVHSYFWHHVSPERVWKYVATGLAGPSALSGGAGMVVLGLVSHFLVAFSFTIILFYIYPLVMRLKLHPFITGILWGLVVWNVMHWIVTPLSGVPPRKTPFDFNQALPQFLIHMFIVGLPMTLVIDRYYSKKRARRPA
jgi:hypothetical protein